MGTSVDMIVKPSSVVRGSIVVPGDKSISHRIAMLSALATGVSEISGFLMSEDCKNTLSAVELLGAEVSINDSVITVKGTGGKFHAPDKILDMGNSGTGMRLLAGLLAGQDFVSEMTGDESLRSRPMQRIKNPLEMMSADVTLLGANGCAPVRIAGRVLSAVNYKLPVASAQVKSCVLLAGLYADGETTVEEPLPTRNHTELLLSAMGVPVSVAGSKISVQGCSKDGPSIDAGEWFVPGDFSSAAFWIVAAACRQGSELTVENVGLNPRRTALIDVLKRMGASITYDISNKNDVGEKFGRINVVGQDLHGTEIGGAEIPNLIDEIPIAVVAGVLAKGRTVIKDAAELRVKESDRIKTMTLNLRALGIDVEETEDGMVIEGGQSIQGGVTVDSYGDHRIAMAMTILGLFAEKSITVTNVDCVLTSYPSFWSDLAELTL